MLTKRDLRANQMRIVGGKFRGKSLVKSNHLKDLRPTTDKNRQALFNILESAKFVKEISFKISDATVLDVCCGTGAVGFEALSRGAKFVTFIDLNLEHLAVVKKNSADLKLENHCEIVFADAKKLSKNEKFFNLVFIDPPYNYDYQAIFQSLLDNNWIQKKSLIVIEFQKSNQIENIVLTNFTLLDLRSYGKTSFAFLVT